MSLGVYKSGSTRDTKFYTHSWISVFFCDLVSWKDDNQAMQVIQRDAW